MTSTDSLAVGGGSDPENGVRPPLEAVNITKRFGSTTALDSVSLTVRDGGAHALVGRNGAGKSTLVSIITGLQEPDSGELKLRGRPAPPIYDRDAWRRLVACVYQKSTIIPTLSVAENLFLNRQQTHGPVISWKTMRAAAQAMVDEWGIAVDVHRLAHDLTVEQRQMVEIVRALSFGARFVILDEPTAQLDSKGVARLFGRLRDLQSQGVSFLYISHHLEEIFEICETVTVFRDARHILTEPVASLTSEELVAAMTGEDVLVSSDDYVSQVRPGPPVLKVENLTTDGAFYDMSLELHPGEVVGITGSGSSGRIALAETIVGLRKADSGTITVNGAHPKPGSVASALEAGVGFVPRDRHHEGLVALLSVGENLTMTVPEELGKWGFISPRRRAEVARQAMKELSVVASGPEQLAGSLSGGNQQKIVMGRALARKPALLVLMHPTAGVDVRSKATLIAIVDDVRTSGTAILIVSDELDDLRPCDRVLVMLHGKVATQFPRGWTDSDVVAATEGIGTHD
jgi:simple sugar transport system ATP-binding protein